MGWPKGKARKPKRLRKSDQIRVLVSGEDKQTLIDAAERAHLPVATWLRVLGLREAAKTKD